MSSSVDPQYQTIHLVVENWEEAKRRAPEEALAEKLLKQYVQDAGDTQAVYKVSIFDLRDPTDFLLSLLLSPYSCIVSLSSSLKHVKYLV